MKELRHRSGSEYSHFGMFSVELNYDVVDCDKQKDNKDINVGKIQSKPNNLGFTVHNV
jgi:hypothetical protein